MNVYFKVPVLSKLKEIEQSNHPTFLVVVTKNNMSESSDAINLFRKTEPGHVHIDSAHTWENEDRMTWPRIAHALGIFDEIVQAAIDASVPTPEENLA